MLESRSDMIKDLLEDKIITAVEQGKLQTRAQRLQETITKANDNEKNMGSVLEALNKHKELNPEQKQLLENLEIYKKAFNDATQESLKNLKDIIEIVSPPSSTLNVFSSIQEYLLYYQESLNHVTEYQKFALIHILASGFILLCLFSLIAVFIGNSLIEYFELSRR